MGLLLTGRRIGADEALRLGLVNEVVEGARLDDAVERWIADSLACALLSLRAIKQMVRRGASLEAREAQQLRLPALGAALTSANQEEGVRLPRKACAALGGAMTYVVVSPCIDVKDGACMDVCPVDCIYEGGCMMYIRPDECFNCGLCLSVCPVEAIFEDDAVPAGEADFLAVNAEFFGSAVTALARPAVRARNLRRASITRASPRRRAR